MSATAIASDHELRGWRKVFAMDLRSLATMRILIAALILIDLTLRTFTLQAMYTDAGFFSVEDRAAHVAFLSNTAEPISWSLHALSGSAAWQWFLFALAAIAAAMMLVGWKTRIACVVTWVLLASLHMRNPLILHSGDCLLRITMFWSMFLPLGACWSLDARKQPMDLSRPFVSGATVGLLLTIFSLYFFAGISKLNSVWFTGEAMDYVMRLDIYATDFGKSLLEWPQLLKWVTWVTLWSEIFAPFLLLIAWKNDVWRYLMIISFVALHLGIAMCMSIGLFSWIAISVWTSMLPASFWNRFTRTGQPREATQSATSLIRFPRVASGFCFVMAAYFLVWNIATINFPGFDKVMPQEARVVGKWLNMRQSFRMFDVPPKHSPWFVYEARLVNGQEVDIFRNKPVDHSRPDSVLATIPHHHWRRLHRNLARPVFAEFRKPVSEYMIRNWNANHRADEQIVTEKTTIYLEEISPGVPRDSAPEGMVTQVWYQHGEAVAQQELFDDLLKKMKEKGIILP